MTSVTVQPGPVFQVTVGEGGPALTVERNTVELTVATTGLQGPPGPQGPAGASGAAAEEVKVFAAPAVVWDAEHELPLAHPRALTYDPSGALVQGDVSYPTPTSVRVTWSWPMAGSLVLTT